MPDECVTAFRDAAVIIDLSRLIAFGRQTEVSRHAFRFIEPGRIFQRSYKRRGGEGARRRECS